MRKFISWSLLGILPLLALLYSAVPLAIYWAWDDFLKQNQLEGGLAHILWRPRLGYVEVEGMHASNTEGRGFHIGTALLDIELLPLLEQKLVVEQLSLIDGHLDAQIFDGGFEVAGLTMLSTADEPEVSADPESHFISGWQLDLQQLHLQNVALCAQMKNIGERIIFDNCAEFDDLQLQAEVAVTALEPLSLDLQGRISLEKLRLNDNRAQRRTLSFQGLSLDSVNFRDNAVHVANLSLTDIALVERKNGSRDYSAYDFHTRLGELAMNHLDFDMGAMPASLAIDRVALSDLNLLVYRNEKVKLPLLEALDSLIERDIEQRQIEESNIADESISLAIESLSLGGNSRVSIIDESIKPQLTKRLSDIKIDVGALDSREPKKKTSLQLQARVGEFGAINLKGTSQLFSEKVNLSLAGDLKAMELVPLSPYSENAAGYKIIRGQLDNHLNINVVDDEIEAMLELKLNKVDVASLKPEEQTDHSGETTVPLGMGLMLLSDSEGNIELDIPVSGNITNPDFSIADAVLVVGRKLITQAVINYYTPYGLINLGSFAVGEATKMRFDSIDFSAGDAQGEAERLQQLSTLLTIKPQLSLLVCPVANGSDWQARFGSADTAKLDPPAALSATAEQISALKALAHERGVWIKSQLLSAGTEPNQVILCAPTVDLKAQLSPAASVEV